MAAQPGDTTLYRGALETILAWAAQKRAQGVDAFALNSGNGNQGLDALLAQKGITLADFNRGAMDLGVQFTTGTSWLRTYAAALSSALGIPVSQTTPGNYTASGSTSSNDWLFYGALALAGAILVVPALFGGRRRSNPFGIRKRVDSHLDRLAKARLCK